LRNNLLYLISLFFILTISCNFKKDVKVNPSIFISESYLKKDSDEKIRFLDSLLNSTSINNDSISRNLLFDLSTEYYYLNQYEKSLKVCKKVLSKSILVKDTLGIAKSYYYMGDGYESFNKDSAYYFYQKSEKFFRLIKKNEMVSRMLFNKAYILFNGGNYIESEIMVSKALKALHKNSDKKLLFTCYNLIASDFERMEEYNNALQYYLLAKQLLNDLIKDKNDIDKKNNFRLMLSVNIANVYERQLEYSKAEKELESVLTEELKVKWPKDYTTVIGNLGYIKSKLGHLKEGEAMMKEALSLSRKSGVSSSIVYKLNNLGKYYVDTKDTLQAIRYLKESLQLAEKLKSTDDVKINLQLLSTIDIANTSYYDKRYITVSDSLTKVQRKNRNKYARIEYETAVVEDANKELSSKNLYLIFGVVVLVAALGVRFVVGQRKEIVYRKQLQAAELELFDLMRSSQVALNSAREEEQNRISRELHDNVMNKLYGTRLQLGMLNSPSIPDVEVKRLEQIDVLQTIEQDIRAISHDLHTDVVASHFDYPVLLAQCVKQHSATTQTNLHLDCAAGIDWEAVSGLVKITLYRMVQEALSNVVKYAAATDCHITIGQPDASTLLLTVRDTGKGFDLATASSGIGLKNMRDRARLVKADFRIESVIGQGTRIECKFVV
jgi:signal transduction histidine kinase